MFIASGVAIPTIPTPTPSVKRTALLLYNPQNKPMIPRRKAISKFEFINPSEGILRANDINELECDTAIRLTSSWTIEPRGRGLDVLETHWPLIFSDNLLDKVDLSQLPLAIIATINVGFLIRIPYHWQAVILRKGFALNNTSTLVIREAAYAAIIAAQLVLRDETHLFMLLEGLDDNKKNLLTYYFDKHGAREESGVGQRGSMSAGGSIAGAGRMGSGFTGNKGIARSSDSTEETDQNEAGSGMTRLEGQMGRLDKMMNTPQKGRDKEDSPYPLTRPSIIS
ncbi:hypothetical protein BJ138DRAFT_1107851 [Hygrophoropsis aurantiaca]|uniref:Uncharacterized protein n=1 Tax=Hygrophoropsis aurantiaca TaxID=72124 RepID=A0ACB7ZQY8_9AGAM|nr:hypothetical protein BJ138DRAFT_1107851 [Hygrophoropsis aurantiaca]